MSDKIYEGQLLEQQVVYPDYSNDFIDEFLIKIHELLDNVIGIENIDGFNLIKNWPYNEILEEINVEDFPYLTDVRACVFCEFIQLNFSY